jgi:NAD(P)H dehydrogenase (quinone)
MLVLTGTSGQLGGGVLQTILEKNLIRPSELIISAYNTEAVPANAKAAGIEVRHGNYEKPETLASSFKGADTLFLVSYPSVSEERYVHHKAAIDAAIAAGIKHIIYTSLTFGGKSGEESIAGVMQAHINTVKYLKSTGLHHTIVREGIYAEIWNLFAGFVQLDDSKDDIDIVVPGVGEMTWASRDELGEATAIIVANKVSVIYQFYQTAEK